MPLHERSGALVSAMTHHLKSMPVFPCKPAPPFPPSGCFGRITFTFTFEPAPFVTFVALLSPASRPSDIMQPATLGGVNTLSQMEFAQTQSLTALCRLTTL